MNLMYTADFHATISIIIVVQTSLDYAKRKCIFYTAATPDITVKLFVWVFWYLLVDIRLCVGMQYKYNLYR